MNGQTTVSREALWPREHGAWGLLLQPFLAGAILAGHWTWLLIPALVFILLGFALRAPLVILARQAFVWRKFNPQAGRAARWVAYELAGVAVCAYTLSSEVSLGILAGFLCAGALLTSGAVWMTIRNRQRSRLFQAASAVAMGSTALLAVSVSRETIPIWTWVLCGVLSLHGVFAILVVHARLERRVAARNECADPRFRRHYMTQFVLIPLAVSLATIHPALIIPPLFSFCAHFLELRRLNSAPGLREPLTKVGFRTLGFALIHLALSIVSLWPMARGRI